MTTLTINKKTVFEEVAKTTSYTGTKSNDSDMYTRVVTTDEDQVLLERFWSESKSLICNNLKKVLSSENEASTGDYKIELELSSAFDVQLVNSMEQSLFSFFVTNIIAKWLAFINKDEAVGYASEATSYMEDIVRKSLFKKKPTRPTYK